MIYSTLNENPCALDFPSNGFVLGSDVFQMVNFLPGNILREEQEEDLEANGLQHVSFLLVLLQSMTKNKHR